MLCQFSGCFYSCFTPVIAALHAFVATCLPRGDATSFEMKPSNRLSWLTQPTMFWFCRAMVKSCWRCRSIFEEFCIVGKRLHSWLWIVLFCFVFQGWTSWYGSVYLYNLAQCFMKCMAANNKNLSIEYSTSLWNFIRDTMTKTN